MPGNYGQQGMGEAAITGRSHCFEQSGQALHRRILLLPEHQRLLWRRVGQPHQLAQHDAGSGVGKVRPPGFQRIGHPYGVGAPFGPDKVRRSQLYRQCRHVGAQGSDLLKASRAGRSGQGGQRLLVQIDGHDGSVRHLGQSQGRGAAPAAHVEDPARLNRQRGELLLGEGAIPRSPIAHAIQQLLEIADVAIMLVQVFTEPLQVVALLFTESLLHHPVEVGLWRFTLQLQLPGLELVAGVSAQACEVCQQIPRSLHPRQLAVQLSDPGLQYLLIYLPRQASEALLEAEPPRLQRLHHLQTLQIRFVVVAIAVGGSHSRNYPQLLVVEQCGAGHTAAAGQFGYFHGNNSH